MPPYNLLIPGKLGCDVTKREGVAWHWFKYIFWILQWCFTDPSVWCLHIIYWFLASWVALWRNGRGVAWHWSKYFYLMPSLLCQLRANGTELQGVCRQSAKAKLKNRHFNGAYRISKPFFLTLQTGLKFPVDKRNIKDVYYSQFQQQENSAKLQILHFWRCLKTWSFALYWP